MLPAADGHVIFLHRLKQGALGFRSGAVDFVGEQNVGEDGTGLKFHLFLPPLIFHDDAGADDIGGHEVRRELNP